MDLSRSGPELGLNRQKHEADFLASKNVFDRKITEEPKLDFKNQTEVQSPADFSEQKKEAEVSKEIKRILELDAPQRKKEAIRFLGNSKLRDRHGEMYDSVIATYNATDDQNSITEIALSVMGNRKTDDFVRLLAIGNLPLSHSDGIKVAERVLRDSSDNLELRRSLLGTVLDACTDGFIQSSKLGRILDKIDPKDPLHQTTEYWLANLITNNKQAGNNLRETDITDIPLGQLAKVLKAGESSKAPNQKFEERITEILSNPQTDPDIRCLIFKQILVAPELKLTKEYVRQFEQGELAAENQIAFVKAVFDIQNINKAFNKLYSDSLQKYFAMGTHPQALDLYQLYYEADNPDPSTLSKAMAELNRHKELKMFAPPAEGLILSAATVFKCLERMGHEATREVYYELEDHKNSTAGLLRSNLSDLLKANEIGISPNNNAKSIYDLLSKLKVQTDPELPSPAKLPYQRLSKEEQQELKEQLIKNRRYSEHEMTLILSLAGDAESLTKLVSLKTKDITQEEITTLLKINIPVTTEKLLHIAETGTSLQQLILKRSIMRESELGSDYCQRIKDYQKWLEIKNPEAAQKLGEYVQDIDAAVQLGITKPFRFSRQALHHIVNNRQGGPELNPEEDRLAVICIAEADHNGALAAINKDVLDLQARGYRVMLYEINQDFGERSLEAAVKECGAKEKIDFLMIAGHGYRDAISLSISDPRISHLRSLPGLIDRSDVGSYASLNPYLKGDSTVYLYSCSTNFQDPIFTDQHTIAGEFVRSFGNAKRIIAAHAPAHHVPLNFDYRDRVTEPDYTYRSAFRNIK